ncbi:MAG: branched-chain amino acid ABC transporter permease [Chloroflexi bacterium]|nr:branched-chain amino acid ABC transporter permease [Chloroflexota bacterium]
MGSKEMDMTTFTSKRFLVPGLISLILLILLATSPLYIPAYTVILLAAILMYIVLTVSWALFSGPTGYISLATSAFFGVGLYTTAILGKELPLLVVVAAGGLVSFVLALIVGAITLRLRGIYFAIFTFGLVELIKHLLLFWEITITGTRGRFVVLVDNITIYYVMLGIFVLLMLTVYFIKRSKFGLAMQSIGDNEEAAAHMGVNVTLVKVITFAISAIFIGAAGAIMATRWTYIDPYVAFNPLFSFLPVLMAIFGGIGQLYGPVIGAAIFAYLEEVLLTKFPYYYMLIFGIILVVVILYLPDGLVGLIQRLRQKRQKGGLTGKHANT